MKKTILLIMFLLLSLFSLVAQHATLNRFRYVSDIQWVPKTQLPGTNDVPYYGISHAIRDAIKLNPVKDETGEGGLAHLRKVFHLNTKGKLCYEDYLLILQAYSVIKGVKDVERGVETESAELWTTPNNMGYSIVILNDYISTALVKHWKHGDTVLTDTVWAKGIFIEQTFGGESVAKPGYELYFTTANAAGLEPKFVPTDTTTVDGDTTVRVVVDKNGVTTTKFVTVHDTVRYQDGGLCGYVRQYVYCKGDSVPISKNIVRIGNCSDTVEQIVYVPCGEIFTTVVDTLRDTVQVQGKNRLFIGFAWVFNDGQLDMKGGRLVGGVETNQNKTLRWSLSGYAEHTRQKPENDKAERSDLFPNGWFRGAAAISVGVRAGPRLYPIKKDKFEIGVGGFFEAKALISAKEIPHPLSNQYNVFRVPIKKTTAGLGIEVVGNLGKKKQTQVYVNIGAVERVNLHGPRNTLYNQNGDPVVVVGDYFEDNGDLGGETPDLKDLYFTRSFTVGVNLFLDDLLKKIKKQKNKKKK